MAGLHSRIVPTVLLAVGAFGLTLILTQLSFFAFLELKGLDLLFTLRGALPASESIVIVAIDEPSIAEIGQQWPWPRSHHARLIEKLKQAGARVIGFDILFAEPSLPDEDQALVRALREAGNVVLVSTVSVINDPLFRHTLPTDLAPALQGTADVGNPIINTDGDGVVRRVRLLTPGLPSFALQVWQRFMETTPHGQPQIPAKTTLINYQGPTRTFKTVSYYQALDYQRMLPAGFFTDKIVLVGWSLQGGAPEPHRLGGDLFLTPFSWVTEGFFPGVEIHATIIDNLIKNNFIQKLDPLLSNLLLLALALGVSAFFIQTHPIATPLTIFLWSSLLLAIASWLFTTVQLWLPIFSAILTVVLTCIAHLLWKALTSERERRRMLEELNQQLELEVAARTFELREQNRQLDSTYRELANTQAQLVHSEKMASLGTLVAGLAHELNNPISYVYNNLQLIETYMERLIALRALPVGPSDSGHERQKPANPDQILNILRELIASSREGSARVKKIVLDLRIFSRMDDTGLALTDLHKAIESTLNLLARQYGERITLHRDYDEQLPLIECYPGMINQVLMNLLQNAEQAIPNNGEVWITTRLDGDQVRITIRDSGTGIAPEHLNRIFEPFFTTKPVGMGTGLGLSISYGIVKKHGGKISARSIISAGTEFILELPVHSQIHREPPHDSP